jgi:hypothetical protein
MQSINSYEGWVGTNAYDAQGVRIGTIDAVYYDDQTGRPEWLAIRTGFFGMHVSFAPIVGGVVQCGNLLLPYSKDQVKDAPNIDLEVAMLTAAEEQRLFRHHGLSWDASGYGVGERFDSEYEPAEQPRRTEAEVAATTRSEGASACRHGGRASSNGPSAQVRRHGRPQRDPRPGTIEMGGSRWPITIIRPTTALRCDEPG